MNAVVEYTNDTSSLSHINAIMSLISIMSSHFLVNSFVLSSDEDDTLKQLEFVKLASNSYLKMSYDKSINGSYHTKHSRLGYIVFGKPEFNFSKIFNTKPKLIIAIYKMAENFQQHDFSTIVIPPSISFFVVLIPEKLKFSPLHNLHYVKAKCYRLYRPIPSIPLKIFPAMIYSGYEEPKWIWESKTNWNSYKKEILNMRDINITIALISHREKEEAARIFWAGKNSFFWRQMIEHLSFRCILHVRPITPQEVKIITKVYIKLLMTLADGLAVLPVISSERDQHVDFILTGLDSKYHLLVRNPQYVHSWQSIFKPFAFESWMCLGIAVMLNIIALRIVAYYQNLSADLSTCGITIFGFLCFQGCPTMPRTLSHRLVCYTALIFSILIYQFYTSNFFSLLSTKEVSLPFNSLEQFVTKKSHALYVHPDTAIYAYIMKAENGTFKTIRENFLKKNPFHQLITENREKSFKRVCRGTGAILGLPFQTFSMSERRCPLVPVNSGYFPANIVTVIRKNFPFKSQFHFVHLKLLEAGISHKYRDEKLKVEQQHKIKADVENEPVSLEHVAFLFAFHAVAIIISWLILGIEIISLKTLKRKKN